MALRVKSRNVRRMLNRFFAQDYKPHTPINQLEQLRVGDYLIVHKRGLSHRSTETCDVCAQQAKTAAPAFSSYGGNNGD